MSWDLHIGDWSVNYTHNMNPAIRLASLAGVQEGFESEQPTVFGEVILRKPTEGQCWNNFDGLPARFAGDFARRIAAEIRQHQDRYRSMEPSNGWGSVETLLEFLDDVKRACDENPDATFNASG